MNPATSFLPNDSSYSDYANDYSQLGNIFEDVAKGFKSVVSNVWGAVRPAAPAIAYRAVTGREIPPQQVIVSSPEQPKTPVTTYIMYGGAALVAGLIFFKVFGRKK